MITSYNVHQCGFLVLKHISYRLLRIGVHFIKHHLQGCIFKMCQNFTYGVVGQRRKLKAIKNKCSRKNKCHLIFLTEFFKYFFRVLPT
jgi:hypothetical protein